MRRNKRYGAAALAIGFLAAGAVNAQTATVDLAAPVASGGTPAAPTQLNFSTNGFGVNGHVDTGGPSNHPGINQGLFYITRGNATDPSHVAQRGPQTFSFSETMHIAFNVTGLQGAGEGLLLPVGTQCEQPAVANIGWNATTRVIQHNNTDVAADGQVVIPCTVDRASTLTIDARGLGPEEYARGLSSIRLTRLNRVTAEFSNLPATAVVGTTATGLTLTCTNGGPDALNPASCTPTLQSGSGAISNLQCTPAAPLASGAAMVCTFDFQPDSATPAVFQGVASGTPVNPNPGVVQASTAPVQATATANVPVRAPQAAVTAAIGGIPASLTPGQNASGTVTCANQGPDTVHLTQCAPSVPAGGGTITAGTCTPTLPTDLAANASVVCEFSYTAPNTPGQVTLAGTATGTLAGAPVTGSGTFDTTIAAAPPGTGGPGGVQAVPTLGIWALGLLGALLAGVAGWRRRRDG